MKHRSTETKQHAELSYKPQRNTYIEIWHLCSLYTEKNRSTLVLQPASKMSAAFAGTCTTIYRKIQTLKSFKRLLKVLYTNGHMDTGRKQRILHIWIVYSFFFFVWIYLPLSVSTFYRLPAGGGDCTGAFSNSEQWMPISVRVNFAVQEFCTSARTEIAFDRGFRMVLFFVLVCF